MESLTAMVLGAAIVVAGLWFRGLFTAMRHLVSGDHQDYAFLCAECKIRYKGASRPSR